MAREHAARSQASNPAPRSIDLMPSEWSFDLTDAAHDDRGFGPFAHELRYVRIVLCQPLRLHPHDGDAARRTRITSR